MLEEWFASGDFAGSPVAAAVVAPRTVAPQPPTLPSAASHQAFRQLLEDLLGPAAVPAQAQQELAAARVALRAEL